MLNQQKPEKRVAFSLAASENLAVNSIFHTIQGEGPFAGTAAVFVRLAGCNLQCPMCDTEYTNRVTMRIDAIVAAVDDAVPQWQSKVSGPYDRRAPTKLVVITGGEPFRQPIGLLIMHLIDAGYQVQVETNGTLYQPSVNYAHKKLTIVCSPKTGKVAPGLLPWIAAWKYVATADSISPVDGLPVHALEHPNSGGLYRPPVEHPAPVFLQPVDEQDPDANLRNQDAVVQSCLTHGYRLCLQLHKIVGLA